MSIYSTCVYWIRFHNMTNYYVEGYIGVSTNFRRRQANHLARLRHNNHDNTHLQRAFNLNQNIIIEPIMYGTNQFCYEFEQQLRPDRSIGWNINVGGTKPPTSKRDCSKTPEHRRKISETLKGRLRCPDAIAKSAAARKGIPRPQEVKDKLALKFAGWIWVTDGVNNIRIPCNDLIPAGYFPGLTKRKSCLVVPQ